MVLQRWLHKRISDPVRGFFQKIVNNMDLGGNSCYPVLVRPALSGPSCFVCADLDL